ncbi:MAG: hypothetical protein F6J96_30800 [Symploca sp. SIO1C2]|nr:hypothetical protein [Symploca sp. SIO1C2]
MIYPTTKSKAIAIILVGLLLEYHEYAIAFTVGAHRRAPFSITYPFNLKLFVCADMVMRSRLLTFLKITFNHSSLFIYTPGVILTLLDFLFGIFPVMAKSLRAHVGAPLRGYHQPGYPNIWHLPISSRRVLN